MATPTRRTSPSSSRAPAGPARRPSARGSRSSSPSGGQTKLFVGLGIAVVAIVLVVVISGGGGGNSSGPGSDSGTTRVPPSTPSQPARGEPAPAAMPRFGGSADKPGKPAQKPAPAIDPAHIAIADAEFEAAKPEWNEAQRLRNANDHAGFKKRLEAAMGHMQKNRDVLTPYTDWLEEADLGGWATPGSYVDLEKRLGLYDPLFQKIKKVDPNH